MYVTIHEVSRSVGLAEEISGEINAGQLFVEDEEGYDLEYSDDASLPDDQRAIASSDDYFVLDSVRVISGDIVVIGRAGTKRNNIVEYLLFEGTGELEVNTEAGYVYNFYVDEEAASVTAIGESVAKF